MNETVNAKVMVLKHFRDRHNDLSNIRVTDFSYCPWKNHGSKGAGSKEQRGQNAK